MPLMPASRGWNKIPVAGGASCRLFSVCGKTLRIGIPSGISSTGPQAAFQDRPVTGAACQWAAGTGPGVPGNWQIEAPAPGRGPENPGQLAWRGIRVMGSRPRRTCIMMLQVGWKQQGASGLGCSDARRPASGAAMRAAGGARPLALAASGFDHWQWNLSLPVTRGRFARDRLARADASGPHGPVRRPVRGLRRADDRGRQWALRHWHGYASHRHSQARSSGRGSEAANHGPGVASPMYKRGRLGPSLAAPMIQTTRNSNCVTASDSSSGMLG
jgi:hypothetical protein